MGKVLHALNRAVLVVGILCITVSGETGRSWRVFFKDNNTWISHPKGLMFFSTLSRTVKPVTIDATRPIDTLVDCIDYDGYLWVSCNAGLYQIDEASQSIERIPLPQSDSTALGKIAQDPDYLWLGTTDKLLRFDKLGREWYLFGLPHPVERMVGLWSNGDEVFCLGDNKLYRFTTSTEKWNTYPLETAIGEKAVFYPGANGFKVGDGQLVLQYQPESFSWVRTNLGVDPVSVFDEDTVQYFTDGKEIKKIVCESGLIRPINIPNTGTIRSLSKSGDTLVLITDKRIGKFSMSKETMDFTEYDAAMNVSSIEKNIPLQSHYILITPDDVATYEKDTKAWKHLQRSGFEQKVNAFTWNEEEFTIRYNTKYQSTLSGSIQSGVTFDWDGYDYNKKAEFKSRLEEDTINGGMKQVYYVDSIVVDSTPLIKFGKPNFLGNLNFHTVDKNDRMADIFLNNTSRISAPTKGIYYRGNRDDRFNSLRLGTTSTEQISSPLLPEVSMEGGSAILESKSRLSTKDRKVVRFAAGTGLITTKTITQVVPYRADGKYKFTLSVSKDTTDTSAAGAGDTSAVQADTAASSNDTLRFVKGSCKVTIDGEVLDPAWYNFYYSTGVLRFNTMAPIDPVSIILVEYQVQTVSGDDITDIELLPSHHFGKAHYGSLTYSPKDWISAQIGYTGVERGSLNSIFNVAVPVELRNTEKKMMLQLRPELLYNTTNGSLAGGVELKSRIGEKTGIVFNTMFADSDFVSTDTLTRGYGKTRGEYDLTLTHDLRQELPLSYYQHQRFGENGTENRYSFTAGIRFKGLPFVEVNASRTILNKNIGAKDSVTVVDSLFHLKDKLKIRLYETSSASLEKLTHFYKISYDLTHSEIATVAHGSTFRKPGQLSTLSFLLSPIQRIMVAGEMLYRGNMDIVDMPSSDLKQSFNLQMIDAPRGVDVIATDGFKYSKYKENFSTDSIERSISIVLKPGMWYAPLSWISPRVKVTNMVQCRFDTVFAPNMADILFGLRNQEGSMISKELGVNIFPTDEILFINTNEWSQSDTLSSFNTFNKFQYNYNASNTVIAEWNYYSQGTKHNTNLSYERLWTSWLRTNASFSTDIFKDKLGVATTTTGPKLLVIFNISDYGIIRSLSNTHDIDVKWTWRNSVQTSAPDFSYTFGLRLKVMPNIELQVSNTTFKFSEGVFSDFENSTVLLAYF